MPTFDQCIIDGVAQGAIERQLGQELLETYRDVVAASGPTLSPGEADRQAGRQVMEALDKAKIEAKRRQALTMRTRRDLLEGIAAMKERRGYTGVSALGKATGRDGGGPPKGGFEQGGDPPKDGAHAGKGGVAAKALPLILRNKGGLSGAPLKGSVEGRVLAIRGIFDAKMADIAERFQTKLGFDDPNRAELPNIVREAFGEHTGDVAAKHLADAWSETAELARRMFNESGGAIGKIDRWGLPQSHDATAIYRAGKEAWVAATAPLLDRTKMVDKLTGAPFTPKRLEAKLRDTYDRIVTRGLIDREPGEGGGKGMLANQRGEERFLAFKDADSWMAYQAQFGEGDAYAAMMGHLDEMSHDIGLMQILGPNPEHQWQWLKNFATREAAIERLNGVEGAERAANSALHIAQNMYDAFEGRSSMPVNDKLARFGATVRSYLNGASLGGAILTDMPSGWLFGSLARTFMGVKVQGDVAQLGKLLLDPAVRADARRMGFINELARDGLVSKTQDSLRLMTAGDKAVDGMNVFARKLPSAVMRLQGLAGAFEARKRSFRMSFMGALADAAEKTLPDLAAGSEQERTLAQELTARAFTPADWDTIRATPAWTPRPGVSFLRPRDIAELNPELALRVGEMVLNAEQYAVPVSSSLWTRAALLGNSRPGTIMGEMSRSMTMFKTFLVNMQYLYGEEIYLRGVSRGLGKFGSAAWMTAWAAGMTGALTMSGAMTIQLKQLARGLDPLPMNTPQFWGAALLQSGGLGILGDFFYSSHARNGKSAPIVAQGPTGQLLGDIWDLTGQEIGDTIDRANGHPQRKDQQVSRIAHDLAAYTPGATLWWARAAFDRAIVDQLHLAMDPDAKIAFARRARQMERENGSGAWWPQGEALPTRAPNMAAATGAPPPP